METDVTVRPRPTWSGRETVAWALLGALALALAWLLLPESSPIWLFPAVLVMLAARASRRQLLVAWLLLLLGGLPLLVLGGGGRGVMMAACLGLDLAVTLVVLRYLLNRGNALLVAFGAACLRVTLELLWSHTPVGEALTWGLFVVELAPLAEVMDFGGASAGSAVVVLVSSGLGLLLADHERPYALRTVALNLGLLALLLGIGLDRIERPGGTPVRVAAIGAPGQEVRRLVALTERAAAASARVVVWPRASVTLTGQADPLARQLSALARENSIWLILGAYDTSARREVLLLAPPFGRRDYPREAAVGAPPEVAPTRFGGLAAIRGGDVLYRAPAARASAAGANLLALPTRDSPRQAVWHLALARLRAIEHGMVVVRASSTSQSVVIDPFGRVVARSEAARAPEHALVADVPIAREGPLFARARQRFPLSAAALLLLILALPPTWRPAGGEQDAGAGRF